MSLLSVQFFYCYPISTKHGKCSDLYLVKFHNIPNYLDFDHSIGLISFFSALNFHVNHSHHITGVVQNLGLSHEIPSSAHYTDRQDDCAGLTLSHEHVYVCVCERQ